MRDLLLSFGLIIFAGSVFRRIKPAGIDTSTVHQGINSCVLNVFLPALCVKTLYQSSVGLETVFVPATAWITTLVLLFVAGGIYAFLGRGMPLTPQEKGVLILSAAFGNVTYLGLPVLTGLFGIGAAKYALFYDLFATTPLLWLVGASLASRYGEGKKLDVRESLRIIAALPPVWGIFTGIILNMAKVPLPLFVVQTLDMFGRLVVPLMIFSIGLALSFPRIRHAWAVVPAVLIKLLLAPFIAFVAAKALGLADTALASCAIEGGMPSMVLSMLVAARFKLDVSLAAFMILVTTVLSFFTLPLIITITHYFIGS